MALSTGATIALVAAGAVLLIGGIYVATRPATPAVPPPETVQPYAGGSGGQPPESEAASIVGSVSTVANTILGRVLPDRNADAQRAHDLELACINHPEAATCRRRDAASTPGNSGGSTRDAASTGGNGQSSSRDPASARTNT